MPRHQSLDKLGIGAGSAYHLNFCIVEPSPPSAEGSQIQLSKQKKPPNPIWGWRIFGSDSRIRTCDQPVTNVTSGFPKGSDYIITVVFNDFRCRALSEGLFLSSPSSLCTFRAPFISHGLDQDRHFKAFPEFTRFSLHGFPWRLLTLTAGCSTTELCRSINFYNYKERCCFNFSSNFMVRQAHHERKLF